ncbi:multipolar spindle 1 [Actinidia rufa]|uniref:Multipolar spindle 1 n=1 Tax=Actinidia rufa TaxID=165716 RepID=A0A7J0DJ49_9ERIC|nr:multipolar spindle 1 [Actinidia rufa]
MSSEQQQASTDADTSLKFAIAMALLRSKLVQKVPLNHPPSPSATSESNAQKWKRKAKERKRELLRLKEDLKQAEVRLSERRRKRDGSTKTRVVSVCNSEDETEQLRASVDFLVELCDNVSPVNVEETNFLNWSHQAVDFILELHQFNTDAQFHVQHLIRKLGSESYVGQRVILSVSQRIAVLAESLLFKDPIDDAFLNMHDCLYMMIQLIEFLVSDYLLTWSRSERFDTRLFEEWATSVLHARKALQVLESRNGLYMLYMDRVIGDLAKQAGQLSSLQKINPDIIANLLR